MITTDRLVDFLQGTVYSVGRGVQLKADQNTNHHHEEQACTLALLSSVTITCCYLLTSQQEPHWSFKTQCDQTTRTVCPLVLVCCPNANGAQL